MHTEVSSVQVFGQRDRWPEHVTYVGMPGPASRGFGIPDHEGLFGKPWALKNDPRGWAVAYSDMMAKRLLADQTFAMRVRALHGRTLLCYCSRKAEQRGVEVACHARILAEYVELLFHSERPCPTSRFDGEHAWALCTGSQNEPHAEHAACAICHADY